MIDRDVRRYERAVRVVTFGEQSAADFVAGSKATTHFADLRDLIRQVDLAKAQQLPSRVSKSTLLDALHLDLKNIARTARSIELVESGFAAPYRLPDDPNENALVTHADAVLGRLESLAADSPEVLAGKTALRARFIACELPEDFVTELRAARESIKDTNEFNENETREGVKNTRLLSELLDAINEEVVHLDAIMHNKYTRQPEKLRVWQTASHVERAPKRAKKKTVPTPTPTPA